MRPLSGHVRSESTWCSKPRNASVAWRLEGEGNATHDSFPVRSRRAQSHNRSGKCPMNANSRVLLRAQGFIVRKLVTVDNRLIIAAAALVGMLTLVVKVTSMLREVLVAAKLGTSDAVEAYIAAWAIPGFLALIIGDAIVGTLLPLHAKA